MGDYAVLFSGQGDTVSVGGIKASQRVEIIKFSIEGEQAGLLGTILEALGDNGINIWFVVQARTRDDVINITLCVDPEAVKGATAIINDLSPDTRLSGTAAGTVLSVFPYRDNPDTAHRFFKALEEVAVPVLAVSTSLSSLSCLVPHDQTAVVREALEKAFGLKRHVQPA
jgi:aspartokinase